MRAASVAAVAGSRVVAESLLVFSLVLAYLWLFRTYGFDVVDEGTQLAQIDRVARGARPYLDFETGYTPWYFALEVAVWRVLGGELLATRTFGVVLHAATIALLFGVARRWLGALPAVTLAAFDLAFLLPVSPRAGAPFNTPYPGWVTAPLALLAQVLAAMVVHARCGAGAGGADRITSSAERIEARSDGPRDRASDLGDLAQRNAPALLAACGAACGVAFSVKPNAGALALGGALLAVVTSWPADGSLARVLSVVVRVAAVAGAVLLLGTATVQPAYASALLLPVVLAAWRAGAGASVSLPPDGGAAASSVASCGVPGRTSRDGAVAGQGKGAAPLADVVALAVGFLVPIALWALPLLGELGAARFAREVLLLDGGGVVGAYLLPFPAPTAAVVVVCLALLAGLLLVLRAADVRADLAGGLASLGLFLAVLATGDPGDAGVVATVELACLWLASLLLTAALLVVPAVAATARVRALLAFAAIFALQLFPRPDLIHLAMGGPPLLLALGAALAWAGDQPALRLRTTSTTRRALAAVVLAACAARAYPALAARLGQAQAPLDAGPRAPLTVAAAYAPDHAWLGDAVRAIQSRTGPSDAVFYFPDLAGLGFLADRPAPFFYVYFVPGRPDRAGEERTIAQLEQLAPPVVVTGSPRVPAFAGARTYFARLGGFLDARYRTVADAGGVLIRERVATP